MRKSEDLRPGFSRLRVITQACLSQKLGCGTSIGAAAILIFGGKLMKNNKLILSAVALVAVIALFAGIWLATRPETAAGEKAFTLTVVHKDGTEKVFNLTSSEEFLGAALVLEGIIIESDSPGLYNTVDGETADFSVDQSYWNFSINGESAMEGMNTTPITDGGQYKLEYTVYVAE